MFDTYVIPYLSALTEGTIVSRTLKLFGLGESQVEDKLRERMNALTNPTLAPYAKNGEVELRITAQAGDREEALKLITPVEYEVRQIFGPIIYGADVPSLESVCFSLLKDRNQTLACAESCTGGLIARRITDLPGASAVFKGGVVSYATEIKERVLHVPHELLERVGAVSPEAAEAMAQNVRKLMEADYAVAVTGVAGPDPDERGNPVGLVYIALAWEEGCYVRTAHIAGDRERVRVSAANHAFDLLRRKLTNLPL